MRVRNFILADAVAGGPQGKTFVHGAGVSGIAAAEFPYVQPQLGLLLTLVYESPEDDIEHHVEIVVEDDEGTETAKVLEFTTPPPTEGFDAREAFRLVHLVGDVVGLEFEHPGRYWIILKLDDTELDRMVLGVGI